MRPRDAASFLRYPILMNINLPSIIQQRSLRWIAIALALYAMVGGAVCLSGWILDIRVLTDWLNNGFSVQPNTALLIILSGAAVLLFHCGLNRVALSLGIFVAIGGAFNLSQHIFNVDFGFNHQLLFDHAWGRGGTVTPGRFGIPASLSFICIGVSIFLLGKRSDKGRGNIPRLMLAISLLMMFSFLGYLFGARNFYAIPSFSAISLPTVTLLMALALSLIVSVPQYHPMRLLCERSGAGSMARIMLPMVVVLIPLLIWVRVTGYEMGLYDIGTSLALGAASLMLGVVALMWVALIDLRRREHRERETDRRKDEFLATLAHELRNPLAPISNAVTILKTAQNDPVARARATATIDRQLVHMVRLVDDLLNLSRITNGKLEIRREHVEVAEIIRQALDLSKPLAQAAGQEITLKLPPQAIYLDADPVRLAQALGNLLNNACKFAGPGGAISVNVSTQDHSVSIAVKDNGIGIPADKLDAIFDMFWQVDQSLERTYNGLGIGLTLAKRLVELHRGSIRAYSEGTGKGAELVIHLPTSIDQAPRPKAEPIIRTQARNRILIVDDNLDSANTLAEILTLSGNEIFLAHDGEAAVLAAEQHRPDAILLDIGLPKLNGFDACRRIRAQAWAKNTMIIAQTGWGQEEDRRKSAGAGFDIHLVKPVQLAELMDLLSGLPPRR